MVTQTHQPIQQFTQELPHTVRLLWVVSRCPWLIDQGWSGDLPVPDECPLQSTLEAHEIWRRQVDVPEREKWEMFDGE